MYQHVPTKEVLKIIARLHFKFFKKNWGRRFDDPKAIKLADRLQIFCERANIGVEKSVKCLFRVILHNGHNFYPNMLGSGYHAKAIVRVYEWEKQRFGTNRGANMMMSEDDNVKIFNKLKTSHETFIEQRKIFETLLKGTEVEDRFWELLFDNPRMSSYYIVLDPMLYEKYKDMPINREVEDLIDFFHHHPDFTRTVDEMYKEIIGVGMSSLVNEISQRTLCRVRVSPYLGGMYK